MISRDFHTQHSRVYLEWRKWLHPMNGNALLRTTEDRRRCNLDNHSVLLYCPWIVSAVQAGGGSVLVLGIFPLQKLGPLTPSSYHLKAAACLSIIADHVHLFMVTIYPSFNGYFEHHVTKQNVLSDWFHEHNEFAVFQWSSQTLDLDPVENIWHAVEREILSIRKKKKSAPELSAWIAWSNQVNMNQNLTGMVPASCGIHVTKVWGRFQSKVTLYSLLL